MRTDRIRAFGIEIADAFGIDEINDRAAMLGNHQPTDDDLARLFSTTNEEEHELQRQFEEGRAEGLEGRALLVRALGPTIARAIEERDA
jgi:hypothetical protein